MMKTSHEVLAFWKVGSIIAEYISARSGLSSKSDDISIETKSVVRQLVLRPKVWNLDMGRPIQSPLFLSRNSIAMATAHFLLY